MISLRAAATVGPPVSLRTAKRALLLLKLSQMVRIISSFIIIYLIFRLVVSRRALVEVDKSNDGGSSSSSDSELTGGEEAPGPAVATDGTLSFF